MNNVLNDQLLLNILRQHVPKERRDYVNKILQSLRRVIAGQPTVHVTKTRSEGGCKVMHVSQTRNPLTADEDMMRIAQ